MLALAYMVKRHTVNVENRVQVPESTVLKPGRFKMDDEGESPRSTLAPYPLHLWRGI